MASLLMKPKIALLIGFVFNEAKNGVIE